MLVTFNVPVTFNSAFSLAVSRLSLPRLPQAATLTEILLAYSVETDN